MWSHYVTIQLITQPVYHSTLLSLAREAADSFPFSGGAEIKQANEKQPGERARLGGEVERVFFPPVRERLEKERKRLLRRLCCAARQTQPINHSFKRNSVKFDKKNSR